VNIHELNYQEETLLDHESSSSIINRLPGFFSYYICVFRLFERKDEIKAFGKYMKHNEKKRLEKMKRATLERKKE
jgi:hypothetical protein